jgi:hypothetical protein
MRGHFHIFARRRERKKREEEKKFTRIKLSHTRVVPWKEDVSALPTQPLKVNFHH